MNAMQRAMTAIGHNEPDQVPVFHLLSYYGAKEAGLPVKDYFSRPEIVAETQLRMREKYSSDCFYTFAYAPVEVEAFGGEVLFTEDGPPNAGEPFIKNFEQIKTIEIPDIIQSKPLARILETTRLIKQSAADEIPIIGVVMSPFSLPVMQLGFEKYLELIYSRKEAFSQLMQLNEEFCVAWANAQLQAGATAICYFDPLASPAMIEKKTYLETGYKTACRTIGRIKGAVATHLASGISLPVVDDIASTGSAVLGFSAQDNIEAVKQAAKGKICLLGNLSGIEMAGWDAKQTRTAVQSLITKAASGGGLILSDNHGEIPWQVPEDVLLEIAETVKTYGTYPIKAK